MKILYAFWVACSYLLGPTWLQNPSKMVPGGVMILLPVFGFGWVLEGLGASWGPRIDFNTFLVDFWWILVDFWKIFEWFFNDFCDGCHPCLIPQVSMNVLNFLLYVSFRMIFQCLLWWLSLLFDTAAHHECFDFCLCVSFCVRFPGNRCSCSRHDLLFLFVLESLRLPNLRTKSISS